ncbi:unnamed protein product [Schistosoma margrebowiei]|uniref:Uncharacterized protein n=1 Tax=Schistosoma margrebowiei TaxID=48269 RepID=A0A183N0H0_9TREM|nr:unnamed protein product [Schistosoma margrebowiei]
MLILPFDKTFYWKICVYKKYFKTRYSKMMKSSFMTLRIGSMPS